MSRSDGSTADYYELPAGATELQDLISHRNMNAQIGEIFRAGYRYGLASHSDMLRDAKKIRFYADAEVKRLEKLQAAEAAHLADKINTLRSGSFAAGGIVPAGTFAYIDPHDTFGKPLPVDAAMSFVDESLAFIAEPAADIDDDSPRMRAIGQNGNDGLHYDADRPSWDDAPFYAVAYIDWAGSVSQRPGFYADGGDRFLRIVDRLITDHYVVKDGIESLGYPVYYRPSKDA